jgi:signal transduction histidine kinase
MLAYYGILEGIGFGLTYVVGCLLIAILGSVTLQADKARNESQALLAELQVANQKLQDYARQIEALAAAEERNRLARELHDSVSQTIFSMNLTAQSAFFRPRSSKGGRVARPSANPFTERFR